MILDDLKEAYRETCAESGQPLVIISMQIAEEDIRVLRPKLETAHVSLSEFVRHLIGLKVRELA
jgi:hypothetical protein